MRHTRLALDRPVTTVMVASEFGQKSGFARFDPMSAATLLPSHGNLSSWSAAHAPMATPHWRRFDWLLVPHEARRTEPSAGTRRPISSATMAMVTISSTSVNAGLRERRIHEW